MQSSTDPSDRLLRTLSEVASLFTSSAAATGAASAPSPLQVSPLDVARLCLYVSPSINRTRILFKAVSEQSGLELDSLCAMLADTINYNSDVGVSAASASFLAKKQKKREEEEGGEEDAERELQRQVLCGVLCPLFFDSHHESAKRNLVREYSEDLLLRLGDFFDAEGVQQKEKEDTEEQLNVFGRQRTDSKTEMLIATFAQREENNEETQAQASSLREPPLFSFTELREAFIDPFVENVIAEPQLQRVYDKYTLASKSSSTTEQQEHDEQDADIGVVAVVSLFGFACIVLDLDLKVRFCNPAFLRNVVGAVREAVDPSSCFDAKNWRLSRARAFDRENLAKETEMMVASIRSRLPLQATERKLTLETRKVFFEKTQRGNTTSYVEFGCQTEDREDDEEKKEETDQQKDEDEEHEIVEQPMDSNGFLDVSKLTHKQKMKLLEQRVAELEAQQQLQQEHRRKEDEEAEAKAAAAATRRHEEQEEHDEQTMEEAVLPDRIAVIAKARQQEETLLGLREKVYREELEKLLLRCHQRQTSASDENDSSDEIAKAEILRMVFGAELSATASANNNDDQTGTSAVDQKRTATSARQHFVDVMSSPLPTQKAQVHFDHRSIVIQQRFGVKETAFDDKKEKEKKEDQTQQQQDEAELRCWYRQRDAQVHRKHVALERLKQHMKQRDDAELSQEEHLRKAESPLKTPPKKTQQPQQQQQQQQQQRQEQEQEHPFLKKYPPYIDTRSGNFSSTSLSNILSDALKEEDGERRQQREQATSFFGSPYAPLKDPSASPIRSPPRQTKKSGVPFSLQENEASTTKASQLLLLDDSATASKSPNRRSQTPNQSNKKKKDDSVSSSVSPLHLISFLAADRATSAARVASPEQYAHRCLEDAVAGTHPGFHKMPPFAVPVASASPKTTSQLPSGVRIGASPRPPRQNTKRQQEQSAAARQGQQLPVSHAENSSGGSGSVAHRVHEFLQKYDSRTTSKKKKDLASTTKSSGTNAPNTEAAEHIGSILAMKAANWASMKRRTPE